MLSDWLATMEWRVEKSSRWLCLQCIFHTHTFGSDARRSPTANPAALLRALLITYLSLEMLERTLQRSLGASRLIFSLLSPVRLPRSSKNDFFFPIFNFVVTALILVFLLFRQKIRTSDFTEKFKGKQTNGILKNLVKKQSTKLCSPPLDCVTQLKT